MIQKERTVIQRLPDHLVDQIKAGEVVERPASLLKELIENSVDANATKIEIRIKEGGISLISVSDNGHGIPFEELPLAFARHATSKINNYSDLFSLASFGFRGEALASISSISRVSCSSRTTSGSGGKIVYHGGEIISHIKESGSDHGTDIVVQDLFYNTPVRLKFAKSVTTEKNAIRKIINHYLIAYPSIHFLIQVDGEEQEGYPPLPNDNHFERIKMLSTSKKSKNLNYLTFDKEYEGYRAFGAITSSGHSGNKLQYLLANKRPINDRSIHAVVLNTLKPLWLQDSGNYFILIETPANEIDVNVHPNKTEVKFSNSSLIYNLITRSIKDLIPKERPTFTNTFQEMTTHSEVNEYSYSKKMDVSFDRSEEKQPLIRAYHKFLLTQINDNFFIINEHELCHHFLTEMFNQFTDESLTPILVAPPFNFQDKFRPLLKNIQSKDYPLDFLTSNSFILRAIPSPFSQLPYLKLLSSFFNDENLFGLLTSNDLSLIFKHLDIPTLAEKGILSPIYEDDFARLLK